MVKKLFSCFLVSFLICFSYNASANWSSVYAEYLENAGIELYLDGDLESPINRQAAITMLVKTMGVEPVADSKTYFADDEKIDENMYPYIQYAHKNGIIVGDGGYLSPNDNLTREQFTAILGRAIDFKYYDNTGFSDDSLISPWALQYVNAMVRLDIINGYMDNTFRPANTITWGEAIKILAKAHMNVFDNYMNVSVVAGNGNDGLRDDISALAAEFNSPSGMALDIDGNLYVADSGNSVIRMVNDDGVTTYVGNPLNSDKYGGYLGGYLDAALKDAAFKKPSGLIKTSDGFLISDTGNNSIRFLNGGHVYTLIGSGKAGDADGVGRDVMLNYPTAITMDNDGNIYICDTGNNLIKMYSSSTRAVTTLAGGSDGNRDGNYLEARFSAPQGIFWHNDSLYVADSGNNSIRRLKDGKVTTVAGNGDSENGDFADGPAGRAKFNNPTALVVTGDGVIYVADTNNGYIRKIEDGYVTTPIGLNKKLVSPSGLIISKNKMYVSDSFLNVIYSANIY